MIRAEVIGTEHGVEIDVERFVADQTGPVVTVFGGVHGDELEGRLAAAMLGHALGTLERGEVRVAPRANPDACAAIARESAGDGKNLARCFPGDPDGTVTERIALVLTRQLIAGSDLLIDLHSGGFTHAMPFFAGYAANGATGARSEHAASVFAAPITWQHDSINPGRSISAAAELGVPALYVEGGTGGHALDHGEVRGYVDGVLRVLASMGMVDAARAPSPSSRRRLIRGGAGDTDVPLAAKHAGYCLSRAERGRVVAAGDAIAEVRGSDGRLLEEIVAPVAGTVMLIRAVAPIEVGDGVAMLGPTTEWIES